MIQIRRRPYLQNFTGNPIVYELFDNDAIDNADMSFEVRVVANNLEDGVSNELAVIPASPVNGVCKIDVSNLLDNILEFFVPDLSVTYAQKTGKQSCAFYIEFRSVTPDDSNPAWISTEYNFIRYAFKGGISTYAWKNNNFFTSYVPAQKPFYTWQMRNRLAAINERIYLSWINLNFANGTMFVYINITYTDKSTDQDSYTFDMNFGQYRMFYLPAGIKQLGLDLLHPDKNIWYWDVELKLLGGSQSEKYRFFADNRNDYNQIFLQYRNSLGGIDTVRVRGAVETNITLAGTDYEQSAAVDWPFQSVLPRMDNQLPHLEMPSYKGDIGHLTKEEQDRLRDAFVNREVYMEKNGRWWPIKLITKQYKLRSTQDKRFTLPIEWAIADAGSYYYTPQINLGDGVAATNVCTSTVLIQSYSVAYDGENATVTFNYLVAGNGQKLQWRVPGFQDVWQDIPFALNGSIEYTVAAGTPVELQMRVVCPVDIPGTTSSMIAKTLADGPDPNSNIYNDSAAPFTYIITRNGIQIAVGNIDPGEYGSFYAPAGNADYEVTVTGIVPNSGLFTQPGGGIVETNTYGGTITGNKVKWTNVYVYNFGCIIHIA